MTQDLEDTFLNELLQMSPEVEILTRRSFNTDEICFTLLDSGGSIVLNGLEMIQNKQNPRPLLEAKLSAMKAKMNELTAKAS